MNDKLLLDHLNTCIDIKTNIFNYKIYSTLIIFVIK